jgi:signal transduction histidine kinase
MNMEKTGQRSVLLWLAGGSLVVLCCVLAVLQYRWTGELSRATQERLRSSLQASLHRLSRDFNSDITAVCQALLPSPQDVDQLGRETAYARRYAQWTASGRDDLVRRVALAVPENDTVALLSFDPARAVFAATEWPEGWESMRNRLAARVRPGLPQALPGGAPQPSIDAPALIEVPRFVRRAPGEPSRGLWRGEAEWLIVELNVEYIRDAYLPELLQRHLAGSEYQAEVVSRADPGATIYRSGSGEKIGKRADASAALFEVQYDWIFRRGGPGGSRDARSPMNFDRGRWLLSVRHRTGSLETLVARARLRNLAISIGILLLMLVSGAALVRSSRQAHRLAELQMNFVAGVSHELRTPLTVIRTAAFNLRRKLRDNPAQVERYGTLIEQESEKLTAIVEQVLRFASAAAGKVIREREPVAVADVVENALLASKGVLDSARCVVEKQVDGELPLVIGDSMALQNAIQNLIHNAVKYGTEGSNWIGVFASAVETGSGQEVEIRVADRGPGIPQDEQPHIFDAFFRGKRAVQDQIHGTGLGLNLVKRIVEAHGGTVTVKSEHMKGTEFVVRIPVAPAEHRDEFAHSAR